MNIEGLDSKDWNIVLSKIKRANVGQLSFIIASCESEITTRDKTFDNIEFEKYYIDVMNEIETIGEEIEAI